MRVINLGGGVQSTTMTLMAEEGKFGAKPDLAIYADTGWDAPQVIANIRWVEKQVSFPVVVVSQGNLRENLIAGESNYGLDTKGFHSIPTFIRNGGQTLRQCTNQYKIQPIMRELRNQAGLKPGENAVAAGVRVEQWLGISVDEIWRAKDNLTNRWARHRFPLVEQQISRHDCLMWWERSTADDAPALVKSSCLGCPYHSASEWRTIGSNPDFVADVEEVEQGLWKHNSANHESVFLHRRRIPIREAIQADIDEHASAPSLLEEECSGYCGL